MPDVYTNDTGANWNEGREAHQRLDGPAIDFFRFGLGGSGVEVSTCEAAAVRYEFTVLRSPRG